ncbi:MAG: hypothetical protein P1V33_12400 [Pseudohongiella nitratireducens]|nr:hypothetical protein [Pseudohongiella nitratireducens]
MNILYIHGFGSKIDPNSDKQIALRKIANVTAYAPDYTRGYRTVMADVDSFLREADLLIGTSMGGFLVSRLSEQTGKKFVAINPVINTKATLSKYIGSHTDHYDRPFTLDQATVDAYPDFLPSSNGMVLLDMGDELIDSFATLEAIGHQMTVHTFAGGSHRFSHIDEALPLIGEIFEL